MTAVENQLFVAIHVAAGEAAMGFGETDAAVAVRFATYVEGFAGVIGRYTTTAWV